MCSQNNTKVTVRQIAELCYNKFRDLPKTGKPTSTQWTVLAGVVQYNSKSESSKVVAIATGTKCIGRSKLCKSGLILNDCHAEVLARRSFLRYLHHELRKVVTKTELTNEDTIFTWDQVSANFVLNENVDFHFLSTQTPCGDACIAVETEESLPKRQRLDKDESSTGLPLIPSNSVYTGAKLISQNTVPVDEMLQTPGALRTKPGRGERTLSMSCSDKLARWNVLGLQGALLDLLIKKPIYFTSYNFTCADARLESLNRAIYTRWSGKVFKSNRYQLQEPIIRIDASVPFEHAQRTDYQPAPSALIWTQLPVVLRSLEITVNGKRQGVTKKQLNTPQAACDVSKYKLLASFLDLLQCSSELREKLQLQLSDLDSLTYAACKLKANDYQLAWTQTKTGIFQQWTCKSKELLEFSKET